MAKKIFLISGLIDLQTAGNQTFKNTVYYLARAGFEVTIFSFLPNDYPGLLQPENAFGNLEKHIYFYRLPHIFSIFFKLGKRAKDLFKKEKNTFIERIPDVYFNPDKVINYFEDLKIFAQFIYFLFWIFYIFFETTRVLFFSLKEKPDLFYGYEIYGAPVASIIGKIFQKPVITRFQGTALNIKRKTQWKYFPHHVFGLKSKVDAIIMGNDGTRGKEVLLNLGIPENKIYFWINGLDLNDLVVQPEKVKELKQKYNLSDKKVILCVSKLKLWKRIDRQIFTVYKLKKDYQMQNFVLLIVGDGHEMKNLKNLVKKYGIENEVKFIGAIPHREVANYFQLADLFLITNDVSNLSNQLLEALYIGVPVVTLNDGSTKEILRNNYNAILVSMDKISDELPKAVYQILTNKELSQKLRENVKITAKNEILSWENRMEKEINLISKTIL